VSDSVVATPSASPLVHPAVSGPDPSYLGREPQTRVPEFQKGGRNSHVQRKYPVRSYQSLEPAPPRSLTIVSPKPHDGIELGT